MKKAILTAMIFGAFIMNSCSNNGKKAEVKEAKEVVVNNSKNTLILYISIFFLIRYFFQCDCL